MNFLAPVNGKSYGYSRIIGTGGVGSGMFFNLEGDHTLGRNESRSGKLMPYKDYCKLHIIMHYPTVLLGKGQNGFNSYPISSVGNDDAGFELLKEIKNTGMDIVGITQVPEKRTLFSVCFQYPDNSGGNITTNNSASEEVSNDDIDEFFRNMPGNGENEIILSAPEVPLAPRMRLLEHGRERGSFNVCAILSEEASKFLSLGGLEIVDLLAVNIDEAAALLGGVEEGTESVEIAKRCGDLVSEKNSDIMLIVTAGSKGSYAWHGGQLEHIPIITTFTNVVSTAGAGDSLLGGVISGLVCGLPFIKGNNDDTFAQTPLKSAVELGTLISNIKVTSPDTIFHELDVDMLYNVCISNKFSMSPEFKVMFMK